MENVTVTRADIVSRVIEQTPVTRQQAAEVLEAVLDEVAKNLAQDQIVKISSFGTFSTRSKNPRMGRNPRTGKEALISARRVVSFKASSLFKKSVSGIPTPSES